MHALYLVLYIIAAVCFALAAADRVTARVNLVALGLLAWVLVPLIQTAQA
jgi:hypothetical protein